MNIMDLEPEQAIAALRRRRQWTVLGALLALTLAFATIAAASLGMYSTEFDAAQPTNGR
jgi:hypothetical protein